MFNKIPQEIQRNRKKKAYIIEEENNSNHLLDKDLKPAVWNKLIEIKQRTKVIQQNREYQLRNYPLRKKSNSEAEKKKLSIECFNRKKDSILERSIEVITSVQLLSRVGLCEPMNRSTTGLPVLHQLPESTQTHVHWVGDAIQPSYPLSSLLLLPPIFPSISDFSNESALCIKWPKY